MNKNSSRNTGIDDKQDSESNNTMEGEADELAVTNRVPFVKLFSFADSKDVILMVTGTIAAIVNGWKMPIMAILGGQLVDSFARTDDALKQVSKVALQFVYLGLGSGLASFFQVACWMITGERQAVRIRGLYLTKILSQEIAFFDKDTTRGEVTGSMSRDIILIQGAIGEKAGEFVELISAFLASFIIAFVKGWLLTLVMLSSIPVLAICATSVSILINKQASRAQADYLQAGIVVDVTISSIRTVASFTGENQAILHYDESLTKVYKSGVQEGVVAGLGLSSTFCIVYCTYALATWFGARMIIEKGYMGGDVINVIVALLTGCMSLGNVYLCLGAFATGQAAAFKVFKTINRKPEIDASTSGIILDDIHGDIEFRDVYFSYPTRPDGKIFNGFSLCIPSGMTFALVGQSGSEILIDGINLKEFQLLWVRGKIGLVSQEPLLFTSSIKDNISYGKENATLEVIRVATELANAAQFIENLPQGLDTLVGENGTQLSGGQKQRIAIARAILKDPKILLLDEATSALDTESERIVQEALDKVMVDRTTVIVAHRLSTVRNADTIVVIHQGNVVEKGTHLELLKNPDGAYCQLVSFQEVNKAMEARVLDGNKGVGLDSKNFEALAKECEQLVIGYFAGRKLPFFMVEKGIKKVWNLKSEVNISTHGVNAFVFKFANDEDRRAPLELGSFYISKSLFIVRPWSLLIEKSIAEMKTIPVWVLIYNVPLHLWNKLGLSSIASFLGNPLMMDECTKKKTRLNYARVCVEISFDCFPSLIPLWIDGIHIMDLPVQYQWKPSKCLKCSTFGHVASACSAAGVRKRTHWTPKKVQNQLKVKMNEAEISTKTPHPCVEEEGVPSNESTGHQSISQDSGSLVDVNLKENEEVVLPCLNETQVAGAREVQPSINEGQVQGADPRKTNEKLWTYSRNKTAAKKSTPKPAEICYLNPFEVLYEEGELLDTGLMRGRTTVNEEEIDREPIVSQIDTRSASMSDEDMVDESTVEPCTNEESNALRGEPSHDSLDETAVAAEESVRKVKTLEEVSRYKPMSKDQNMDRLMIFGSSLNLFRGGKEVNNVFRDIVGVNKPSRKANELGPSNNELGRGKRTPMPKKKH